MSGKGLDVKRELTSLKQRFESASAEYDELRASAESAVQRWVWATAPCYHLDPLYFLDPQIRRGRIAESAPSDPRGWTAYGFTNENSIRVERIYLSSLKGRHYSTFYRELDDRIVGEHFHYEPPQGCINSAQLIFSDRRPALYQRWASGGYVSRAYIASDGKIRSVLESFQEADEPPERMSRELRYRDDGRIELWTQWPGERKATKTFSGAAPTNNPFLDKA